MPHRVEDIVKVVRRNRLRRYGHVLRKDDWVEKYVTLEIDGAGQRGALRKTWKEVVDKDANSLHLNPSDAVDGGKSLCVCLRFKGHFPGGPELAGTRMSPFWILLKQVMVTAGCWFVGGDDLTGTLHDL